MLNPKTLCTSGSFATASALDAGSPEAAAEFFHDTFLASPRLSDDIVRQALLRLKDEDYEEALDQFDRALTLNPKYPEGIVSMPTGNEGSEWFEFGDWRGIVAHIAGLHLANVQIAREMAHAMGDKEFETECRKWLEDGSRVVEETLWAGEYYLNWYEKETGLKSDAIMGYQLDGQCVSRYHGLGGVFRISERLAVDGPAWRRDSERGARGEGSRLLQAGH